MVNFAMPKLFSLIQSHLFIFNFVSGILGVTSKNSLLCESVELHIGVKSLSGFSGWEGPLAVSSNWGYGASWVGIIVQPPFSVGPQATFSTTGLSHWQGSLPGQGHLMCSVMWQSPGLGLPTPRGRSLGSTARCSVEFFLELPRLIFRLCEARDHAQQLDKAPGLNLRPASAIRCALRLPGFSDLASLTSSFLDAQQPRLDLLSCWSEAVEWAGKALWLETTSVRTARQSCSPARRDGRQHHDCHLCSGPAHGTAVRGGLSAGCCKPGPLCPGGGTLLAPHVLSLRQAKPEWASLKLRSQVLGKLL